LSRKIITKNSLKSNFIFRKCSIFCLYCKRIAGENNFTKTSGEKFFCTLSFSHFHTTNSIVHLFNHHLKIPPIKHEGKIGTTGLERVFRDHKRQREPAKFQNMVRADQTGRD
jgi:hypothetical protein